MTLINKKHRAILVGILVLVILSSMFLFFLPSSASAETATTTLADLNYVGTDNKLYSVVELTSASINTDPLIVSFKNFKISYRTTSIKHNIFVTFRVNLNFELRKNGTLIESKTVSFNRGGMDTSEKNEIIFSRILSPGSYTLTIGGSIYCVNTVTVNKYIPFEVI